MMKRILHITILSLLMMGCDQYEQDSYREFIVVEGYAVANNVLPQVRVTLTVNVNEEYNPDEAGLTDANVQVVLLDENGNDEEVFEYYYASAGNRGIYLPLSDHKVLPSRTYRLDISFDDRPEIVQATTTVPDDFEVINEIPVSITYQSEPQLELIISETEDTQPQKVFVFTAIARHVRLETLTPFYRSSVDNDDVEISDFAKNSSGLINEENFEKNPDGTITLKYPWLGIAFYGENRIVTHYIDKNLVDLFRSEGVQLGGSTLSPGEIPNLIYNTEGGIGVFGSLSSDTVVTNFLRPPSDPSP